MNDTEIYNALQNGGAFSLPFLIKLSHPQAGTLYYVNNTDDVKYNNITFKAAAFKYTKPQTMGGVLRNGSLQISAIENNIIELLDNSDEMLTVEVMGVIDAGEITPLKTFRHKYGTATIDEKLNVIINFTNDDRLKMVFPPYIFDTDNNRGNA